MVLRFRPIHSSILWRATYVVCALAVFSFVLFDILDIDGSDFPSLPIPVERSVVVAEVPSDTQCHDSPEPAELWGNSSLLFLDRSGEYARLEQTKALRFSPLDSSRAHGYRVGLPRDLLPDFSPSV